MAHHVENGAKAGQNGANGRRDDYFDLENMPHVYKDLLRRPKTFPDILEVISNTPLVKLNRIPHDEGVSCDMYAKCEFLNPGGSVKDRIAYRMVLEAEQTGRLVKGKSVIIEPTSGNTGIGLALAAAGMLYAKCSSLNPVGCVKERTLYRMVLEAEQTGRLVKGKSVIIEPTSGNTGIGLALAAAVRGGFIYTHHAFIAYGGPLYAKCESLNPVGCVKERILYRMVLEAEQTGRLVKGKSVIIEPTSGNTGIGLALAAAVRAVKGLLDTKCSFLNPVGCVRERILYRMVLEAEQTGRLVKGKSVIIEPTSGNTGIGLALAAAVTGGFTYTHHVFIAYGGMLYAKCSFPNPVGCVKERTLYRMVLEAEQTGRLVKGKSVIIEPTSGNTGIGLALAAALSNLAYSNDGIIVSFSNTYGKKWGDANLKWHSTAAKGLLDAKWSFLNPVGCVKERTLYRMVLEAEQTGRLVKGKSVIIEPTSGNTGIGLALAAAVTDAKCSFLNPVGCVKERTLYRMVLEAEQTGRLVKGKSVIIEPTSGNTGIGLALAAAVRGGLSLLTRNTKSHKLFPEKSTSIVYCC
ncbi:pyridoxal-phosphate dependent enzyme domain-containing protein [Phthorimaea operculella]|nr:pyridoxal-phosphate dependent enzyme domain-containing protein [Phthorimaea operculella]